MSVILPVFHACVFYASPAAHGTIESFFPLLQKGRSRLSTPQRPSPLPWGLICNTSFDLVAEPVDPPSTGSAAGPSGLWRSGCFRPPTSPSRCFQQASSTSPLWTLSTSCLVLPVVFVSRAALESRVSQLVMSPIKLQYHCVALQRLAISVIVGRYHQ